MVQLGEEDSEHDIGCNNLEDLSCREISSSARISLQMYTPREQPSERD